MEQLKAYLASLKDAEIKSILSSYSISATYDEFISARKHRLPQDERQFIIELITYDGCIDDPDIKSYIKCLKKEVKRFRSGKSTHFHVDVWAELTYIEKLFGVTLS